MRSVESLQLVRFVSADRCGELPSENSAFKMQEGRGGERERPGIAHDFTAIKPCSCLFADGGGGWRGSVILCLGVKLFPAVEWGSSLLREPVC